MSALFSRGPLAAAAAVVLAGCPFSNNDLNTLPFYCASNAECTPTEACVQPLGTSYKRCLEKGSFCSNKAFDAELGETDEDCGGPCGTCGHGHTCKVDADCESGVCGHLWSELRCVPPSGDRMVEGQYVPPACACPEGPPCEAGPCMFLETCDGSVCRVGCYTAADCPIQAGHSCVGGVCVPDLLCDGKTTAFFCAVPGDVSTSEKWGFATCEANKSIACSPLPTN